MRSGLAIAAAVLSLSLVGVADAATLHFATSLKGSDEVPPNTELAPGF